VHWIFLVLVGVFEIGFTTCMKLDGFKATDFRDRLLA
jgi:multidrug transporter EmrE-like cation transporter